MVKALRGSSPPVSSEAVSAPPHKHFFIIETSSRFERWQTGDVSPAGVGYMMTQKINGHTADFLKRQAKHIKKQQGISHAQALDLAARQAGCSNWKEFIKSKSTVSSQGKPLVRKSCVVPGTLHLHRKLIVAGINELVNRGLISLESQEEIDPIGEDGHILIELLGYPSVIIWRDHGFQELLVSVWWNYDHASNPKANEVGTGGELFTGPLPIAKKQYFKKFVGVAASGWLERRRGAYLHGIEEKGIFNRYTRKGEKVLLENLSVPVANGFAPERPAPVEP